jgi:hypothetical protein
MANSDCFLSVGLGTEAVDDRDDAVADPSDHVRDPTEHMQSISRGLDTT